MQILANKPIYQLNLCLYLKVYPSNILLKFQKVERGGKKTLFCVLEINADTSVQQPSDSDKFKYRVHSQFGDLDDVMVKYMFLQSIFEARIYSFM